METPFYDVFCQMVERKIREPLNTQNIDEERKLVIPLSFVNQLIKELDVIKNKSIDCETKY